MFCCNSYQGIPNKLKMGNFLNFNLLFILSAKAYIDRFDYKGTELHHGKHNSLYRDNFKLVK